jgi:trimeric autotransporter adhesin
VVSGFVRNWIAVHAVQQSNPNKKRKNMTTLHLRKSIGRSPLPRRNFTKGGSLVTVLLLALCCFAPCSVLQAVTPAPDGGYSGFNTAEGTDALYSLTTGSENTAIGYDALYYDTIGAQNTAIGLDALFRNTSGNYNTANGLQALYHNTIGSRNTATGMDALFYNTTGVDNTAIGLNALLTNTTGVCNTANGVNALYSNAGSKNTASGFEALYQNTTGGLNTANGFAALYQNTTGVVNTANGAGALYSNTAGHYNSALGVNALAHNTTGSSNIALGNAAGTNLTTGSGNIEIGHTGVAAEANTIRIGTFQTRAFMAGVKNAVTSAGVPVYVNASGQLGTNPSSRRFKEQIKAMDKASEALLALKPVTFRYKHEIDPNGIAQFGLVAEEVAEVDPDLVVRDAEGKVFSVRYEAVNAMLLNEFLKEHRKFEEQQATIAELESSVAKQAANRAKQEATIAQQQKGFESKIAHQQMQIEALTAGLQRVSARVEISRPTPQTVLNNQ